MGNLGVGAGVWGMNGLGGWPGEMETRVGAQESYLEDAFYLVLGTTGMVEVAVCERDWLSGACVDSEAVPEMGNLGRGRGRTGSNLGCTLVTCLWFPNLLLG